MRVTVIGATGHIGTWLVPGLVRAGHDVIAISRGTRQPYRQSPEWSSVRQLFMDREVMERDHQFGAAVAALRSNVVIDLICFDVSSARELVEELRHQVDLVVHCGTLWVHGSPDIRPYDETAPRKPFGDYGVRKAEIESFLLGEAERGFPVSVLHPGHITGPGWAPINPAGNLDVRVFRRLSQGEEVILPEDGSATLQHVHVSDVAQAFLLAVEHAQRAVGSAFHVAARHPVTMREYAIEAAKWFGQRARLSFLPWNEWKTTVSERDAEITLDHLLHSPCASIERAQRVLGYEPRYTAVQAARDAVSAFPAVR